MNGKSAAMGRKKIQITRIMDERNRQVSVYLPDPPRWAKHILLNLKYYHKIVKKCEKCERPENADYFCDVFLKKKNKTKPNKA